MALTLAGIILAPALLLSGLLTIIITNADWTGYEYGVCWTSAVEECRVCTGSHQLSRLNLSKMGEALARSHWLSNDGEGRYGSGAGSEPLQPDHLHGAEHRHNGRDSGERYLPGPCEHVRGHVT